MAGGKQPTPDNAASSTSGSAGSGVTPIGDVKGLHHCPETYLNSLELLHRQALQPGRCSVRAALPRLDDGRGSHEPRRRRLGRAGGGARALPTLPSPLNVWVGTIERRWPVRGQWARHYGNCVAINFTWMGPTTRGAGTAEEVRHGDLGVLVGAMYGGLIGHLRRFPVWARALIVSMALVALVLADDRIYQDSGTAQPWMFGRTAFAVVLVASNVWQLWARDRSPAH